VSPDDIRELFAAFGPVAVRRMFGGAGIFADGTMFALVHDGVIYLKADAHNAPAFERENLGPFTYLRRGERASLSSYRRMPDRLYDDPDELAIWARAAFAAARGGRTRKPAGQTPINNAGRRGKTAGAGPYRRARMLWLICRLIVPSAAFLPRFGSSGGGLIPFTILLASTLGIGFGMTGARSA